MGQVPYKNISFSPHQIFQVSWLLSPSYKGRSGGSGKLSGLPKSTALVGKRALIETHA